MNKVLIIGGGPAGIMAAGTAAMMGNEVHLFEKNNILGRKLYITGKGRCNITNNCLPDELIENITVNPYFMYSAFYTWESKKTIEFFKNLGVKTKVERGNRVFPVSDKAADVVKALEKYINFCKVKLHLETPVRDIIVKNNAVKGLITSKGNEVFGDKVIIATGGLSYPQTGSTGDGYKMAKTAGHSVTKLYPNLVPLVAEEQWCEDLMGLSLKNVAIVLKDKNKKVIYTDFGEMLFTHFGVSGPMIISASSHLPPEIRDEYTLIIDLKPALDEKILDTRILKDFEKYINKDFKNSLDDLLPQKLIPVIIKLSGIDEYKKVHDITKEERKNLVNTIKNLTVHITGKKGYDLAIVTGGGIDVDQINPSTMESKIVKGLYFAGEVIDVDGYTGGFNLQIAFSTGYLAGKSTTL